MHDHSLIVRDRSTALTIQASAIPAPLQELSLEELETINAGWSFSGGALGGMAGGVAGHFYGGTAGAMLGFAVGGLPGALVGYAVGRTFGKTFGAAIVGGLGGYV